MNCRPVCCRDLLLRFTLKSGEKKGETGTSLMLEKERISTQRSVPSLILIEKFHIYVINDVCLLGIPLN